ncbi:MFS transporter [Salibacterium salarium]|uniref:MFS transporter n=1 Tax=Salibacterium salarium TaxID=284579 RepID=A0A428N476_9BACI|nr:MFS transporter [Salibacterium salarium]RSL33280.1 MFS transporter [Salibacterium salarium]
MIRQPGIFPLMVYLFFAYSALTVIVGYAPIYFQFIGITQEEIGWLMAMGPLASVFAQPFWGYMSDKWKTMKKVLMICMGSAIVISVVFFQMESLWTIMVLMFSLFLFLAPCTALGDSLTQKTVTQRGLNFGSIRMWGSLGFAITSLVTGFLLEQYSPGMIYLPFLTCAILAFSLIFVLHDAEPAKKPVTIIDAVQFGMKAEVVIFLALLFFISIGHRANDSFLGLYIIELGGQESLVGRAWFIGVISEAVVFFLSALWFRRFHPLFFIVIAGLLYASRWFVMGVIDDPVYILWLQVFHGITFGLMYFSSISYMTRIVPEELQATGHLLFITTFFGISGIAGSLGGGWAMEQFGGGILYTLLGVCSLIGSIFLIVYGLGMRMNVQKEKRRQYKQNLD